MTQPFVELRAELFSGMVFKPHGDYAASLEGSVIHSEIAGPINAEMVQLYRAAVRPLWLQAAAMGRFGTLAVFRDNMLMTMDAITEFAAATQQLATAFPNYVGIAQVAAAHVVGRDQMAYLYRHRVYGPLGLRYEIFETVDAARSWINDVIAERG